MLSKFRQAIGNRIEFIAELIGLGVSVSGASAAVIFGKVFAASVLAAVALGFVLRLGNRRAARTQIAFTLPAWARSLAALASVLLVASLVEATNFPVRFDQTGFLYWHWFVVLLALALIYWATAKLIERIALTFQSNGSPSAPADFKR